VDVPGHIMQIPQRQRSSTHNALRDSTTQTLRLLLLLLLLLAIAHLLLLLLLLLLVYLQPWLLLW
jgi:hypothetical protein